MDLLYKKVDSVMKIKKNLLFFIKKNCKIHAFGTNFKPYLYIFLIFNNCFQLRKIKCDTYCYGVKSVFRIV